MIYITVRMYSCPVFQAVMLTMKSMLTTVLSWDHSLCIMVGITELASGWLRHWNECVDLVITAILMYPCCLNMRRGPSTR